MMGIDSVAVFDAHRARELEDDLGRGVGRLGLLDGARHRGRWRRRRRRRRPLLLRPVRRRRRRGRHGQRLALVGFDAAAVDAGHQPAGDLDRNLRPLDVIGIVERLVKGDRTARDQCQVDLLPVLAAEILHRRPALQGGAPRRSIARQGQAIRRLPHRHFDDIGHAHRPLALAPRRQLEGARLLGAVALDGEQRLADLVAQGRIGELQVLGILENELLQAAVG